VLVGGRRRILELMDDDATPVPDIAYYPSGALKSEGFMLDGEMHGDWAFYRLDGSVMRTGRFERGRQVGPWRTFDRTGRMVKETDFGDAR
jgi:antitoxin component YwqK of YwqJK toxin-antitoxin module